MTPLGGLDLEPDSLDLNRYLSLVKHHMFTHDMGYSCLHLFTDS